MEACVAGEGGEDGSILLQHCYGLGRRPGPEERCWLLAALPPILLNCDLRPTLSRPRAHGLALSPLRRVGAIGSTLRLKQRFGSGYSLSVSVLPPQAATAGAGAEDAEVVARRAAAVKAFFKVRAVATCRGRARCLWG